MNLSENQFSAKQAWEDTNRHARTSEGIQARQQYHDSSWDAYGRELMLEDRAERMSPTEYVPPTAAASDARARANNLRGGGKNSPDIEL